MELGRPTDYRPEFDEQAYKLCLLGHTDDELGVFFEVTKQTINNWKSAHPNFFDSIKRGKEIADMEIAESLRKQALGYHYEEESEGMGENGQKMKFKNKRFATADFRATRFWLMNRQPDKWREKTEVKTDNKHQHTGNVFVFGEAKGCEPINDADGDKAD